jgi:hypothetical protein
LPILPEHNDWNHFVLIAPPNQRIRILSATDVSCVPIIGTPNELGCRHVAASASLTFTVSRPPNPRAIGADGHGWVLGALAAWMATMVVGGLLLSRRNRAA